MEELKKYRLGELIDVTRGASLSGDNYATSGEYVRLTCGNFDYINNCFKENKSKENIYYIGSIREEFIMSEGDIITPLTEQAIGLLGSTALIPESNKYIQSQDIAKIVCKNDLLDHNYCFYLISSNAVKQQLSAGAQQTKIRHTSPDKIKDCTVWIPCIEKQKKIGNLLSNIDLLISTKRNENSTLEAMAKEIYDYWFVQFDFPNQDGKPYKSSGGKMVFNEILKREIPEGWEVKRLGNFISLKQDRIDANSKDLGNYSPIEVLPRNKMSFNSCAPIEKALSGLCSFDKYDILLSNRRVYFHKLCIAPFNGVTRDTVFVIVPYDSDNLGFLYETLNTDKFIEYATKNSYGSGHPVLSWSPTENYCIEYSDIISHLYSSTISSVISQVIQNENTIKCLTSLRDYLLPLLMNGQVEVKEAEKKFQEIFQKMPMAAEEEAEFGR